MKKLILIIGAVLLFGAQSHMQTNDKDLKLAMEGKYKQAFDGFEKRCENNDAYACGMVAYFYNKGYGVNTNLQKAIEYYKKGCRLKDPDSCTLLGYFYYKGTGVKKDLKKALSLLKEGCNLGNKDACNYLNKIE